MEQLFVNTRKNPKNTKEILKTENVIFNQFWRQKSILGFIGYIPEVHLLLQTPILKAWINYGVYGDYGQTWK